MPDGIQLRAWQLFFTDMTGGRVRRPRPSRALLASEQAPLPVTWQLPGQLALFSIPPDVLRFVRARHANPHNPALIEARVVAQRDAETLGWSKWLAEEVDEALEMVLSAHAPGDLVRYSDLVLVDQRGGNVGHTATVLGVLVRTLSSAANEPG